MIRYTFGNSDRYFAVKRALLDAGYTLKSVCHQGTGTIIVDHPEELRATTDEICNLASAALRSGEVK